ncbi:hypothetical protein CEUSTIGMA_g5769.t1 [Chlamydomonas eustigma]|uniref:Prostaglandin E synthase 2 n=1 Tax=Chlamydomonas eustigma TaxID=1157962 RepID=A0A250X5G2_9CHLO|nr:hypothetical protein CEUSTIGMA_g5769.t1 [Chlamydomonas eustigma]|eukprot:GAX78327.1 hypothetical protein CEUSTIGMA_g5769.t1 [Chlamydomonas eustigma]
MSLFRSARSLLVLARSATHVETCVAPVQILLRQYSVDQSKFTPPSFGKWAILGGITSSALFFSQKSFADAKVESKPPEDEYIRPPPKGLPKSLVLYQYEVCPYCCKVKAALDYYKLPYIVVEVNPLLKSELSWSSYKKVPVLKMDEEVVVGSSAIVSRLTAEVEAVSKKSPSKKPVGQSGISIEEEVKWRKWVDEKFVKILTANIYRSWSESWDTFKYITEQTNWSWGTRELARSSGAILMWQVGKRMPAKYGIEGDLREALYRTCNELVDEVGLKRPFLGGSTPNMADLAVYGVLKAVEKTPTFLDAMHHSRIEPWYIRMTEVIGPSSRVSTEGSTWGLSS